MGVELLMRRWLIAAKLIDRFRLIPRLMVAGYGWLMWDVSQWFMHLPEPSGTQAAFVSTLVGAGAAVFGLYVNSGDRK